MGYKLYSNITCPNPAEGATENIGEDLYFVVNGKHERQKKMMYSNYQMIKILESCFQNMNCFSWIKVIAVLIDFNYCNYNTPSLKFPCFPCHACQISPCPTETPLQRSPHVLHRFSEFIINLYIKLLSTFQKAESFFFSKNFSRASSVSKLDNTIKQHSIFNTKCTKFSAK